MKITITTKLIISLKPTTNKDLLVKKKNRFRLDDCSENENKLTKLKCVYTIISSSLNLSHKIKSLNSKGYVKQFISST